MKKLLLAVLLTALSVSSYSADKEIVCEVLANKICDTYNCYIVKQFEHGDYYCISMNCPKLWEGDAGFAISEINHVLNKYKDITTIKAFTADVNGNLTKVIKYEDLKIDVEYFIDSNAILLIAYADK